MARWHSFNKEDWCYRGPGFVGTAFLMRDKFPARILVWGFTEKFTTEQLHNILWLTQHQFPDVELWCEDRETLGSQIDELAARGIIKKEQESLGQVHILQVNEPTSDQPSIHFLYERAWRGISGAFRKILTGQSTENRK